MTCETKNNKKFASMYLLENKKKQQHKKTKQKNIEEKQSIKILKKKNRSFASHLQ